jgi:hypothetical protein
MLVKCIDSVDCNSISNSVSLVPRLEYSLCILHEIIEILKEKRDYLKKSNKYLINPDENDKNFLESIKSESLIIHSLEILFEIQKITCHISGVNSIPKLLPPTIPLIRITSAQLFNFLPDCSQKLSELSVHLGSIVLDSAAITTACFDFRKSNEYSTILSDKVKLIADSKISKQYPNHDFFKSSNT